MNGYRSGSIPSFTKNELGEIDSRESGKLSPIVCAILSATVLLYSLFVPLFLSGTQTLLEVWAWAMTVTCIIFAWFLVKKMRWTFLITLISLFFISFSGSPLIPAIVLGTLVAVCAYSSLVCACGNGQLAFPIAVPFMIYGISVILTFDPVRSLLSLLFILPALALGLFSRLGSSLNVSVLACTAATILPMVAFYAVFTYSQHGGFSYAALTSSASAIRELLESFTEHYISVTGQVEMTQSLYGEIAEMVNSYVNLAPGIIVAVCLVASFIAHSLKNDLLQTQGIDSALILKSRALSVSTATALVFLTAHIMSFTTDASNNTTFIAVVFGNISFMLVPCLAFAGINAIMLLPKKLGILGIALIAVLIIILFSTSSSFFILLALIGAFFVIIRNIDSWAKEFYGKGDNK